MIFRKPKDMTYTDLCIWIDNNAYKSDCDEEKLFQYIYVLVSMFAHKNHYFKKREYYEEFALITAERFFLRLRNPKQFEYKADGTPRLKKLDSILNYMKLTLYPLKVDFEQETYKQLDINNIPKINSDKISSKGDVPSLYTGYCFSEIDITEYMERIPIIIKDFLKDIPYPRKSADWLNIYTSCLLTFLNSITLSNHNKERCKKKENYHSVTVDYLNKLYKEENINPVILFHLDDSMRGYIMVLTNRIKTLLIKDLLELHYSNDSLTNMTDDMLANIALSEIYAINI